MNSLAAMSTNTPVRQVDVRFHALKDEGRLVGAPAPTRTEVVEFFDKAAWRASHDPALNPERLKKALAEADAARTAELPDGPTFHAWQHLQADCDAQRVQPAGPAAAGPCGPEPSEPGRSVRAAPDDVTGALLYRGLPAPVTSDDPTDLRDPARRVFAKQEVAAAMTARMTHVPDEDLLPGEVLADLRDPTGVWAPKRHGGWVRDPSGHPGREGRLPGADPQVREGLRQEAVASLVGRWAVTSNGTDAEALAVQRVAAQEFGLVGSASWDTPEDLRAEVDGLVERRGTVYRAFLRAQYDETQKMFREAPGGPVTHVRVHRGFSWGSGSAGRIPEWADPETAASRPVPLRPLSSCSLDRRVAAEFATGGDKGVHRHRTIIEGTVPVSRVLATPRSGVGCLPEAEVVILSGPGSWGVDSAFAGEWGAGADEPEFGGPDEDADEGGSW